MNDRLGATHRRIAVLVILTFLMLVVSACHSTKKDSTPAVTPAWLVLPVRANVETSIGRFPGFEGTTYYLKMTVPRPVAMVVAEMTSTLKQSLLEADRPLGKPTPDELSSRISDLRDFGIKPGPAPSSVVIFHDGSTRYVYLFAWDNGNECTIEIFEEASL